ncbi:ferredoxin reductase-like protein, partial [Pisolithus croceorrhizus]
LVESVQTSSDTKLLTLSLPPDSIPMDSQESTPIWSVFIKDDDIQVERPYTPLEGVDESGNMSFWIKKYEHGEVARWLHSKQVGSPIELRGPVKTWTWKDDTWDDIIMVSGGTGITPFYQLLHHVFSKNVCKGRLTLLHASKTPADLPPAHMMEFLHSVAEKHPDKFRFRVFVDSLDVPQRLETKIPLDLTRERIGKAALQDALRLKKITPWWEDTLLADERCLAVAEDRRLIVLSLRARSSQCYPIPRVNNTT